MTSHGTRVVSSLQWATGGHLLGQAFTWAVTIYVIRILTPADYGLMGIATVIVAFLMLVNELGLGAALVQAKELDGRMQRQAFFVVLLVNGTMFAGLFLAAPLIAWLYEEPRLEAIVRVLGAQFLLYAFGVVPQAIVERRMDFRRKSLVDLAAAIFASLTQLALAASGLGVWALVWGSLVWVGLRVAGMNLITPWLALPDPRLRDARRLFGFGALVTLSRVLWFFYSRVDILIAGKILGKQELGVYFVSMHLATLPMQKLSGIISGVSLPAFSRIQEDRERVATYFLKAVRVMSFVAFPALWGIAGVTPEIVTVFLGESWLDVIVPMILLSLLTPFRMVYNLTPPLYFGVGRPDQPFNNVLFASIVMPIAFLAGVQWGLVGLALAWVLSFPLVMLRNLHASLPVIGLGPADVIANMWRPMLAAGGMLGGLALLRPVIAALPGDVARLAVLILAGVVLYGALIVVVDRRGLTEVAALRRR